MTDRDKELLNKLGTLNLDLIPETRGFGRATENAYWEEVQSAHSVLEDNAKGEWEEDFCAAIETRIKQRHKLTDKMFIKLLELKDKYL